MKRQLFLQNKWMILALTFIVLLASGGSYMAWKEKYGGGLHNETAAAQPLEKVKSLQKPKDSYDVIVAGTDPEGVAAAVSAARNGLRTLLVDGRNRTMLGGLMTEGWLNSLDNNYDNNRYDWLATHPLVLNKGIFQEFYNKIEGTSFDTTTAANTFYDLVRKEQNIDLLLQTKAMQPVLVENDDGSHRVSGMDITLANGQKQRVTAKAVIDATQDGDIYAAAGVPYTFGREDLGDPNTRMAVTVVFRLKNVTEAAWHDIRKALENDGNDGSHADTYSAYGYGDIKDYKPLNPKQAKMRGLNIGRQNDGTILINSLQIFGIDAFDLKSVQQAYDIAKQEIPHVLDFIKERHPEFQKLELADEYMAPELYVRETRHMDALYKLSILDVLENRDQWDRIAFGSYRVDIQSTSPGDYGIEILTPYKYAVPFRSIVPQGVDGLLAVGRSAGFSTLAHGTARVIPLGMATGQSAGAAARVAIDAGVTFRQMAENKDLIAKLQKLDNEQGMELAAYTPSVQEYQKHKDYPGLKAAVYLGIAGGGGDNNFKLDDASNPKRFSNVLAAAKRTYPTALKGDPSQALAGIQADAAAKQPLTLQQAAYTVAKAAGLAIKPEQAVDAMKSKRLLSADTIAAITHPESLTNGDTYMMLKDALEALANLHF